MANRIVATIGSENAELQFSADGGTTWESVPGVSSYDENGNPAPTRDGATFRGTFQRSGFARPSGVSCEAQYVPLHPTWRKIRTARINGEVRSWRLRTAEEIIKSFPNTAMAAVAQTTGIVTFSGNGGASNATILSGAEQVGPGHGIKIGNSYYVIVSISDAGETRVALATTGAFPAALVQAATYSFVTIPMQRGPFAAKITQADNASLQSEANMTTTLEIAPTTDLPAWTVAV